MSYQDHSQRQVDKVELLMGRAARKRPSTQVATRRHEDRMEVNVPG